MVPRSATFDESFLLELVDLRVELRNLEGSIQFIATLESEYLNTWIYKSCLV